MFLKINLSLLKRNYKQCITEILFSSLNLGLFVIKLFPLYLTNKQINIYVMKIEKKIRKERKIIKKNYLTTVCNLY